MGDAWFAGVLFAGLLAAVLHPSLSPIQPLSYTASPPPPYEGPFTLNQRLKHITKEFEGLVDGPEDIISDAEGHLYCSNADGTVRKLWRNGSMSVWANLGGRPLGIEWVHQGGVMAVCEPTKGLLLVKSDGTYQVVSTRSEGLPFRFLNNVDVASDGRVYFTDVSHRFGYYNQSYELLEARPNGRLLRYDPATRVTETLLSGLYFANGVALSQNEDFALVAECSRYRIRRFFLTGPQAGSSDIFIDNLPGMPDNINRDGDGLFWVTLFMPRQGILDFIHRFPALKILLARLPTWTWQRFQHAGMVLAVTEQGHVAHFWTDMDGDVAQKVTTARRVGDKLMLGFIEGGVIGSLPFPQGAHGSLEAVPKDEQTSAEP